MTALPAKAVPPACGGIRRLMTVLALVSLPLADQTAAAGSGPLEVGIGVVDITPPVGGPQYKGPATGIATPLHAKAIAFRQGDETGVLLACDFSRMARSLSRIVRSRAAAATGIPFENICIVSTHTHSGLRYDIGDYAARERANALTDDDRTSHVGLLVERMTEAIVLAQRSLERAGLAAGVGRADGLTQNRRRLLTDGKVRWHGVRPRDVVRPAGPVDPDAHFLLVKPPEGAGVRAVLTVFANHPTTMIGSTAFHADFPFFLHQRLGEMFGGDTVSIFCNGACGDLESRKDIPGPGTLTERVGRGIARAVEEAVATATPLDPDFRVISETVNLPMQGFTAAEYEWALDPQAPPLYPESTFLTARRRKKIEDIAELRQTEASPPAVSGDPWWLPVEIQVFRLDRRTAIIATPGHSWTVLARDLKAKSPFANTMVVEFAHCNIGYTPTAAAFAEGGYQPINSRLAPGSSEKLFETMLALLDAAAQDR